MKLKIKVLLVMCLMLLLCTFSGCTLNTGKADVYNNNEKIAQDGDSYSYVGRNESGSKNEITVKYGKFSGSDTIWNIESEGQSEITIKYDSKVESGDFKGVLISPEKQVEDILVGTETGEKTIKLTQGKYRFKFVGNKAKGKIEISIETEEEEPVKIRKVDND
ncbi:hypothetical protein [Clostridium sp.]|uniref:hypothetical protein n=1 Tax=Clostridium sp. TaxID=1506 RepID=UPI0032174B0B